MPLRRVKLADALSRKESRLDRAQNLCATEVSASRIQLLAPASEIRERVRRELFSESGAPSGIELRRREKRLDESLDVKPRPTDNERHAPFISRISDPGTRVRRPGRG
jgi:hypothetical protein